MKTFDEWVKELTPMIYSIIHKLNIYRDHEDYFQIGLHGLYKAYKLYKPGKTTFPTFAYKYIQGHILNQLKKKIYHDEREVHVEDDVLAYLHSTGELNPVEKEILLKQSIEQLDPSLKRVIHLHYFDGFTLKEIAEQLNVSYPTIKRRHKVALQKLRILVDS